MKIVIVGGVAGGATAAGAAAATTAGAAAEPTQLYSVPCGKIRRVLFFSLDKGGLSR